MKQLLKPNIRVIATMWLFVLGFGLSAVAQGGAARQREDIQDIYKWNLADIYPTPADWEADFALLESSLDAFEPYQGQLGDSPQTLLACLKLRDSLSLVDDNLYVYASLQYDQDQRVGSSQELRDRIEGLETRLYTAMSFIEPEILSIPGDRLMEFLNSVPELDVYRFELEDLARTKEHTLPPEQERILSMAGQVTSGARNIFDMIANTDVKFGTVNDEDGNEIELTRQRYAQLLRSSDQNVRRKANQEYVRTYKRHLNGMAAALAASMKNDWFYTQVRGYETCLERRLDRDNIPTEVFFALIEAVNNNLAPLNKWTAVKKRILGLDTLYSYDQMAPLTDREPPEYTYDEAQEIILRGLKPMGNDYLDDIKMALNSGWVDVFETEGKESGAYNWGTYSSHPYVKMNFVGTQDNVFTLAHELGHAMHGHYRHQVEPYVYGGTSTFTAEVASVVNEMIIMKYLLETTTDPKEKLDLLIKYIEKIEGTFYTQVFFSEFELAMHKNVEEGGAFSADYMRKTYRDLYQKYWGPDVYIDSLNDMGCVRIPHFYRNYYVFQYATSFAASQMLSLRVINDESGAMDDLMRFLHTGNSKYPIDVLKDAGIDMTTSEPVDRTLEFFGQLVDEVEQLLDES